MKFLANLFHSEEKEVTKEQTDMEKPPIEETPEKWRPDFCKKYDTPQFEVEEKREAFEVRRYQSTQWITTSLVNEKHLCAQWSMYCTLYDYSVEGKNELKEKLALTAPAMSRIQPDLDINDENKYQMSFYVSPDVKMPPPLESTNINFTKLPAMKVYVRGYQGWNRESKMKREAELLREALTEAKQPFDGSCYYTVNYDSPCKMFNRYNEIWFIANED